MTQWRTEFTKAYWVDTSTNVVQDDWAVARAASLEPEHDYEYYDGSGEYRVWGGDQALHLLRANLAADPLLDRVFGPNSERIEVVDYFPAFDNRQMPRIYLYHNALSENGVITLGSDQELNLAIAIRWESKLTSTTPVKPGEATVESLVNHIRKVVMSNHDLNVPVGGLGVPIFNRNPRFGPDRSRFDEVALQGGVRYLATREISVIGSVLLDKYTRRVQNIQISRGD